jgi:hypothetical protein
MDVLRAQPVVRRKLRSFSEDLLATRKAQPTARSGCWKQPATTLKHARASQVNISLTSDLMSVSALCDFVCKMPVMWRHIPSIQC